MVGLPIESIKLHFDLANHSEEELNQKISLLTKLLKKSINLKNSIKIYKNLINTDARDLGFDNVLDQLKEIDNTQELKLFIYLYGYYENKFFIAPDTGISLSNIINVLTYVDKFAQLPYLPWPTIDGFLLFNEETESRLLQQGTHTVSQGDLFGRIKVLNAEQDIVLGNLYNPNLNPRKNDILKLFINLKIAECIGITPKIEDFNLQDQKATKTLKNGTTIKYRGENINLDKYVSKLFKKTFDETLKTIKEQNIVPTKIKTDHPLWEELLNEAKSIKTQLLEIKTMYQEILLHFELDKNESKMLERNKLFIEMREFLRENKNKKEYLHLKIDERIFPDRKNIEFITGGSGLMKRISLIDGGVVEFKRIYPEWILNKIDRENARNIKEPDFNKYLDRPNKPNYKL